MTTLFVRHAVSDYKAWRKVYDAFAPVQKASGVKAESVYQAADNPNDVTVTHDFASAADARAFIENPKLKEAMASAGVVGAPTMWITNKA
ncbi:cyclase [Mesorhizobium sp. B2-4-12]|uniref:cyclase n=1 Tax=unclassified Mesorhizobium TaxID=325217 RepID=UPI001127FDEF|nr:MULTISPECIES: cyclase [unclassified Mesorhizobium]TPK83096.1 cyclase [Mesorhizobium sp. B2-4-17]TPK92714.1 cyclase [Mesorhizobium sp. B2-4-12]TPL07853.1 cyclase [Mesorhizobium sp. B2-4-14]